MGYAHKLDLGDLEHSLETALQPVRPREEFIGHLRQRLVYPSAEVIEIQRAHMGTWILFGIFSGLVFAMLGWFLWGLLKNTAKPGA